MHKLKRIIEKKEKNYFAHMSTSIMASLSCRMLLACFAATTVMGEEEGANFQVTCEGNFAIQPPEGIKKEGKKRKGGGKERKKKKENC